jgi:hypothetical protein
MVMVDQTAALLVHAGHALESRLATTMLNATMHQHIVEFVYNSPTTTFWLSSSCFWFDQPYSFSS